jgi:DNA-binding GntR family transcriptional regulator
MLPWLSPPSADLLDRVRDTPLGKLVRDDVLMLILEGQLAPGQRINEPDVAARLKVSRVPVREALRELESSGLVVSRKHAGVFVRVLSAKELADLYELRGLLDAHAGGRAAAVPAKTRQALKRVLNDFQAQMRQAAAAQDVQRYYAANLAFHWAIVDAVDNEALASSYRGVIQQLHLARLTNLKQGVAMRASMAEHQAIVEAIGAGDAARAHALLSEHVHTAHLRLTAHLSPRPTEENSR